MEEIIECPYCRCEYSLYYEDEQVVAVTKCRCEDTNKIKLLDRAMEKLDERANDKNGSTKRNFNSISKRKQ